MTPAPQLDVTDTDAEVARILRALAAYGLDGSAHRLPATEIDDATFRLLMSSVHVAKLSGLLSAAVANGDFPVTQEQRRKIAEAHVTAMSHALQLERLLLSLVETLEAAGIETRVLKGSSVAQLDYEDASLRPFVDVDLLVRTEDFDRSVEALEASGVERIWRTPRPGFDRRFGKGATLHSPLGYEVDLHRTFAQGPFGLTVDLEDLWRDGRVIEVGGRKLTALSDEMRLLHAAIHATIGHTLNVPYLPSRDIAEMLLFGTVDVAATREIAARWQLEALLAEGVRSAWELLAIADVTALSAWAEGFRPSELDERRRAVYRQGGASYTAKSLAALGALPRFRDRVAMATSLAFPSRQFLKDHRVTYGQWLGRGVSKALRSRRHR
jgi:hypothetical protein